MVVRAGLSAERCKETFFDHASVFYLDLATMYVIVLILKIVELYALNG